MKQYMELMGKKCRDRVTGYVGVVSSVSFDLYGCVQVALSPAASNDGKLEHGHWFDHKRLEVIDDDRVLPMPNFDLGDQDAVIAPKEKMGSEAGPAEKPAPRI